MHKLSNKTFQTFQFTALKLLYRKKLHTVYPMLYKPTLKNIKKLNVMNYKHEYIYALAHLNLPTASFKCISVCF